MASILSETFATFGCMSSPHQDVGEMGKFGVMASRLFGLNIGGLLVACVMIIRQYHGAMASKSPQRTLPGNDSLSKADDKILPRLDHGTIFVRDEPQ